MEIVGVESRDAGGEIEVSVSRTFFRIVRGPVPTLEDFLSARDLGVIKSPPAGLEREWAESISVYDDLDYTVRRALTARRQIGGYVARLTVPSNAGIEIAQTGKNRHHFSIYGRPEDLIRLLDGDPVPVPRG